MGDGEGLGIEAESPQAGSEADGRGLGADSPGRGTRQARKNPT